MAIFKIPIPRKSKMKQAIFSVLFSAAAYAAFAGATQSVSVPAGHFGDTVLAKKIPAAPQLLSEIMGVVGLVQNFELKEAKVSNVEASISHHKRYILYNPGYINWINTVTKDKWAALALLAHEVGHHLNGHTIRKSGSKPRLELEADEFAGFVLYKLGATLEQSQEVMRHIATTKASKTHPARTSRMMAIQKGWNKAAHLGETTVSVQN